MLVQVKICRRIRPLIVLLPKQARDSLTLVVPDDLLHVLGELCYISVKELHSSMKPPPFLVKSHPFVGLLCGDAGSC